MSNISYIIEYIREDDNLMLLETIKDIFIGIVSGGTVSLFFYILERDKIKKENFMRDQQMLSHYIGSLRLEIEIMQDSHDGSNILRMIEDIPVLYGFEKLKPEEEKVMKEFNEILDKLKEVSQKGNFNRSTMVRISSKLLRVQGKILNFKL